MFCLPGRLTGRVGGGATEESNRWKSASLPEPPAETNGWERGRLQGSSTWHTLFQGHSWAVDLATGISGEPHRNSRGSPVDRTAEELEPGECRWSWDELNKIWCNLAQRSPAGLLTGTWIMNFSWNTCSKMALGRIAWILIQSSKTVLPWRQLRL